MRFYIYAATVVSAALMTTSSLAQPATCPNPPVVDISAAQPPADHEGQQKRLQTGPVERRQGLQGHAEQ